METNVIAATTTLDAAAETCWDVVVVGSGLAGSVAALELARRNLSVLLLDQKSFPRNKPCGGCLNAEALQHLKAVGLLDLVNSLGGEPYSRFDLWNRSQVLSLNLPPGLGISRHSLDAALIEHAIVNGATFLPATSARIPPADSQHNWRTIHCRQGTRSLSTKARVVLIATGIAGSAVSKQPQFDFNTRTNSRIGLHATIENGVDLSPRQTIHMSVGRAGYVGLARLESGKTNLAAAVSPSALRQLSPPEICEQILAESGFPQSIEFPAESWQGTVALTRSRNSLADERMFLLGDAAGYVEPFTGEGMATALRSARAVIDLAESAARSWDSHLIKEWEQTMRRRVIRRWPCNLLTQLLRFPSLVQLTMGIAANVPVFGRVIVDSINREIVDEKSSFGNRYRSASRGSQSVRCPANDL